MPAPLTMTAIYCGNCGHHVDKECECPAERRRSEGRITWAESVAIGFPDEGRAIGRPVRRYRDLERG